MELILQQRLAQRLLHLALAGDGLLPAGEAHDAHDAVDAVDDLLDDGRRLGRARLVSLTSNMKILFELDFGTSLFFL